MKYRGDVKCPDFVDYIDCGVDNVDGEKDGTDLQHQKQGLHLSPEHSLVLLNQD